MSFIAPDADQCFQNLIALLPRGRAWQTHETFPDQSGKSLLRDFWKAVSGAWCQLEQAVVDLLLEFFCDTAADDIDGWVADYEDQCGLADINLCLKVQEGSTAVASGDLDYYRNIAATLGFEAVFTWLRGDNSAYPGVYSSLLVQVDAEHSVAAFAVAVVGEIVLGEDRLGGSGTDVLACILNHVVPAHIKVIFEVS